MHLTEIHRQIESDARLWTRVGELAGGPDCDQCRFSEHTRDLAPYGNTGVFQEFHTCELGFNAGHNPKQCPALAKEIEEQHETT